MVDANNRFFNYSVECNRTGETWTENFTALDARFIRVPESAAVDGFTYDQASAFVRSMNIAQSNYKSEFTYSLN